MGNLILNKSPDNSRRSYEILLEHCPTKADWDYVKDMESDIPRRYGDKVIAFEKFYSLTLGYGVARCH